MLEMCIFEMYTQVYLWLSLELWTTEWPKEGGVPVLGARGGTAAHEGRSVVEPLWDDSGVGFVLANQDTELTQNDFVVFGPLLVQLTRRPRRSR